MISTQIVTDLENWAGKPEIMCVENGRETAKLKWVGKLASLSVMLKDLIVMNTI